MLSCLALAVGCALTYSAQAKPAPIKVMILGTFHMAGGRDMFNPNIKDVTEPRRQKEAEELVEKIAAFKPTRICIESVYGTDTQQRRFESFLSGTPMAKNEIDQIAFRLAKRCGIGEVTPVDWKKDMDIDGMMKHAAEIGQGEITQRMIERFTKEVLSQVSSEKMEKQTLQEIYNLFNTPEADRLSHSMYIDMLAIGKGDDYKGADVVAGWYERNLKIATNVARVAKPGDRIFLLMGAGHAKLLREYLGEMNGFEIVWPSNYLK